MSHEAHGAVPCKVFAFLYQRRNFDICPVLSRLFLLENFHRGIPARDEGIFRVQTGVPVIHPHNHSPWDPGIEMIRETVHHGNSDRVAVARSCIRSTVGTA